LCIDTPIPAPLPLLERVLEVLFSKRTKNILRFPLDLLQSVKAATLSLVAASSLGTRDGSTGISPGSPRPKARQIRSATKSMLIVFFDIRGIVHLEFAPEGQTVNAEFYCNEL
jgi:hypothetical protein